MILDNFPKKRPELPQAYKDIYDLHYNRNRSGETKATSLSMKMEQWLHKKVAEDVLLNGKETLEIGAGNLNQLPYEPKVDNYDVVEPFDALLENSEHKNRIRSFYKDILEINDRKYDRITSVATFEHILDLPLVVAKAILLMKEGANLRASIPNEGTLFWTLGSMITGAEFKKMYGLDYKVLTKHEHVNSSFEIEAVLRYFFTDVELSVLGLSRKFAFYVFLSCRKPNIDKAKALLESRGIVI